MSGILAIDPGSEITGWGWGKVQNDGNDLELTACGVLKPPAHKDYEERFEWLVLAMDDLIAQKQPDEFCIENPFVGPNNATIIKLSMLAGAYRAIATLHRLPVFGYEPAKWKASLGSGNMTKQQVRDTLAHIGLSVPVDAPLDVSDAVGILRHHYYTVWYERLSEEE